MMVFGGKAMLPEDDDDPLSKAAHLLAQNSFRVTQRGLLEISFFFDPQSVATILKSPMPSLRFFTDLSKMVKNTVDESRDVLFGEESPYDKTPRMYYFGKIIPVSSAFIDFADIFDTYNKDRGY